VCAHLPAGKGMGMGASRSLSSPGELLLVSWPLAAVAAQELPSAAAAAGGEEEGEGEDGPLLFAPYYPGAGDGSGAGETGQGPWEADDATEALAAHMRGRRWVGPAARPWLCS